MTGRIIRFRGGQRQDAHLTAQMLLPWYATGRLDADERALVEAHLGRCPQCQAELALERRLDTEVAELPMDVDQAWAALRPRLGRRRAPRGISGAWRAGLDAARGALARPAPWLGWAFAAQTAALLIVAVLAVQPLRPARYHALGAAPPPASGNVIVTFRPETSEQDLRNTLNDNHARLVDGPTAADAYVLHVPAAERAAALAKLRKQAEIVLAEPIDPAGAP